MKTTKHPQPAKKTSASAAVKSPTSQNTNTGSDAAAAAKTTGAKNTDQKKLAPNEEL